ncbi:MAG: hypothetical protein ACREET_04290 [Stellaceae bacterium]
MRLKSNDRFDFRKRVAYYPEQKRLFHGHARRQLKRVAAALGLDPGDYDLRSNKGGIAVSGEVTLHADRLYVQASQPATGHDTGILFRSCTSRRDYVGGTNHFASLDLLHEPAALSTLISRYNLLRTPDQVRGGL